MEVRDLIIIGGGSAGMAAAIQAHEDGIEDILLIEREQQLGGILNQCIHNGFGLTEFKEELTGPEYAERFAKQVTDLNIDVRLGATVLKITRNLEVTYSSKEDGFVVLKANAIVFATGCYERNAGAIQLPGYRPYGIITAGLAQKFLNIEGYLVGKRVVILGSGDIGLIMARRFTLEGAKVLAVVELMPYSNGLNRNIAQCLNDFEIPLYLSHTVSKVEGEGRVEKVTISAVDQKFQFIPGSEIVFECDTLLLSIGLVPNVNLLTDINCLIGPTKGAIVNEQMETMIPGIFTCGNCLHVHDLVDFVSLEGRAAGHGAALYLKRGQIASKHLFKVLAGSDITYVIPSRIDFGVDEDVTLKFRVLRPLKDCYVILKNKEKILKKVYRPVLTPSEMEILKVGKELISTLNSDLILEIEKKGTN
ncbi:MAG: FAD-dependent oxidoreductase [Bacilli bacterium]|jgi:thioredoxin reductase|nr:FAD-dependent oxidoreductase [Bacilli bacterium]